MVFGEVLCDLFAPVAGQTLAQAAVLVPHLGGAPANVAVQLARLRVPVSLVTAVGADPFGERVQAQLRREGVDLSALRVIAEKRTGATLVEVDRDGERRFFGFRENSADLALTVADVDRPVVRRLLAGAAVVHSGTVSLVADGARAATVFLQDDARRRGAIVSVDVNMRPGMYPSQALLLERAADAVARADVVKATVDEAALLVSPKRRRRFTPRQLADALLERGPRLVLLTDGESELQVATSSVLVSLDALAARVVDATGAGDAFMGACLAQILDLEIGVDDLAGLDERRLRGIGAAGRRAGAAAVTALGATTRMVRRRRR